jgi:hypothetical protein
LRCSRQLRTSPLIFFTASLLIAGMNRVYMLPSLRRAGGAGRGRPGVAGAAHGRAADRPAGAGRQRDCPAAGRSVVRLPGAVRAVGAHPAGPHLPWWQCGAGRADTCRAAGRVRAGRRGRGADLAGLVAGPAPQHCRWRPGQRLRCRPRIPGTRCGDGGLPGPAGRRAGHLHPGQQHRDHGGGPATAGRRRGRDGEHGPRPGYRMRGGGRDPGAARFLAPRTCAEWAGCRHGGAGCGGALGNLGRAPRRRRHGRAPLTGGRIAEAARR